MSLRAIMLVSLVAIFILVACGAPEPNEANLSAAREEAYHPDNDPLINPPELFEPFPKDHPELADEDTTLVRHLIGEPRILNPIFANSWFDFYFDELLLMRVFSRNSELEYGPAPYSVESFEESDDHRVFTVRLKAGLKWQDGKPWTAHDVKFTWEAIIDDQVPAVFWKHSAGQIEDIEVIDDRTLKYIHKRASPTYMRDMAMPVIPKHIFDNPEERAKDPTLQMSSYYNHYNREEIIGSGPYRFVEWITNDRLVVERWEDYSQDKPHFKRQILKIQPDRNIALLLFKKGELDEMWMTPEQFAMQSNDEQYSARGVKGYNLRRMFGYLGWNQDGSNPYFTDVRVRRALGYAFDRERILRDVTHNLYTTSNGLFDPEHWCYNPEVKPLDFDLEKAAALLDEAGWLVSDDDGWRYKEVDGEPVRFDFELAMAQSFADAVKMSNIYQADLRKLGITFTIRILENAAFDEMNLKHEFQAHASVWEVSSDPDRWRNHYYSTEYENGRNFYAYKNDRVDELFDLTREEFDRERRAAQFREIQALVFEDQPTLFMWNYTLLQGFNRRVRGVQMSPGGIFLFYPSQKAWWVPKAIPNVNSAGSG